MRVFISNLLVVGVIVVIFILPCGSGWALDVAIFNDPSVVQACFGTSGAVSQKVKELLGKDGISAEIVDSQGVADYMVANPTGVVMMINGAAPGTIFENKGKDDLVREWLEGGGIMTWAGDWPFYYWDNANNVAGAAGEISVFGVTVTTSLAAPGGAMEPTELGKQYIPDIKAHNSTRPVMLSTLESRGFEFESYADDSINADPVAFRNEDMEGWFVNLHTFCGGEAPADQIALESAQLVSNRFFAELGKKVEPNGRLTTTWAKVKAIH